MRQSNFSVVVVGSPPLTQDGLIGMAAARRIWPALAFPPLPVIHLASSSPACQRWTRTLPSGPQGLSES